MRNVRQTALVAVGLCREADTAMMKRPGWLISAKMLHRHIAFRSIRTGPGRVADHPQIAFLAWVRIVARFRMSQASVTPRGCPRRSGWTGVVLRAGSEGIEPLCGHTVLSSVAAPRLPSPHCGIRFGGYGSWPGHGPDREATGLSPGNLVRGWRQVGSPSQPDASHGLTVQAAALSLFGCSVVVEKVPARRKPQRCHINCA
jgi:hypothetical protein